MFGSLRGKVTHRARSLLTVDVAGVGYEVFASGLVLDEITQSKAEQSGEEVSIIIATDVKENAITLFGFKSYGEREIFYLLKKVKGIGSKTAVSILSALKPEELLSTIGLGETSALVRVPGIGRKTAERIIVELREQVTQLLNSDEEEASEPLVRKIERTGSQKGGDAILALEKLGFGGDRAKNAVSLALTKSPNSDAGEILRLALVNLGT